MSDYSNCAIVYCSSDDEITNRLLIYSLKTLHLHNKHNIDSIVITTSKNRLLEELKLNSTHIVMFDKCHNVVQLLDKIYIDPDKHPLHAAGDSPITFMKLFFPFFPILSRYEKLLYVDCDTEIFHEISQIFDIDIIDGFYFGFDESFAPHKDTLIQNIHDNNVVPLKTNYDFSYINCGVVLINNSFENQQILIDQCQNLIDLFNLCQFNVLDQDLINISFQTGVIDRKYISFYGHSSNSAIIHYVGKDSRQILLERIYFEQTFGRIMPCVPRIWFDIPFLIAPNIDRANSRNIF